MEEAMHLKKQTIRLDHESFRRHLLQPETSNVTLEARHILMPKNYLMRSCRKTPIVIHYDYVRTARLASAQRSFAYTQVFSQSLAIEINRGKFVII